MFHDLDQRILIFDPETQSNFTRFVTRTFAKEDDMLQLVRAHSVEYDLPPIDVRPEEGLMLSLFARLIGARRILEIGTLAGYSGIWLARALPDDGRLITLELEPHYAQIARNHFASAGLSERVEVHEGAALDTLAAFDADPTFDAMFDLVFVDADKENNLAYLVWAIDHVRSGGLILVHNAFCEGYLLDDNADASARATLAMINMMATDTRLLSTIIQGEDGLAVAMVR
jgi:predicted O-methyltransferase YrrM